ncbi:ribosomal protein s2 [Phaffia rhodozyma]|uniref:Ribosomal protein s2 n=1 Tax=Phaffia rhodozyma TaxID=264483 RepID=A0A0F7SWJ3_PHARH|nr:ribosomal protein s2 [Phaffia rhodozyma]
MSFFSPVRSVSRRVFGNQIQLARQVHASASISAQSTNPSLPVDSNNTRPSNTNASVGSPSGVNAEPVVGNETDTIISDSLDGAVSGDRPAGSQQQGQRQKEEDLPEWQVKRAGQSFGSFQTDSTWHPTHSLSKPITAYQATVSHLVAAGTHMGHSPHLTRPSYQSYLAGRRSGIDIINLEHTLPSLRKACGVVRDIARDDGVIVFVGKKKITKGAVIKAVERMPGVAHAVTERWRPGTLTNAHSIFGAESVISGAYLPDLIVVLDPRNMVHIINEANNKNIPTLGLVDSDVDPRLVTIPIYTNIDSARSIELILGALGRAGQDGIKERNGEKPGSRFLLPHHRFQAKIDRKREFDNVEQPIDWDQ